MDSSKRSFQNPLRLILNTTIIIFVILLILYISARVALTNDWDANREELFQSIANDIRLLALSVFDFVRPFLQLVIILIILEWLLNKFGITLNQGITKFEWNVQTTIGIVIIIAFALAALSGVPGAAMLKDVALVVVGFYFGTQKKINEVTKGDTKTTTIEEHTNNRSNE